MTETPREPAPPETDDESLDEPRGAGRLIARFFLLPLLVVGAAVAVFLVCAFAALALGRLGFRVTIALSLAFLLGVVERKGFAVTAAVSIVFAGAAFFLFDTLLRVPLPRGPFGL